MLSVVSKAVKQFLRGYGLNGEQLADGIFKERRPSVGDVVYHFERYSSRGWSTCVFVNRLAEKSPEDVRQWAGHAFRAELGRHEVILHFEGTLAEARFYLTKISGTLRLVRRRMSSPELEAMCDKLACRFEMLLEFGFPAVLQ